MPDSMKSGNETTQVGLTHRLWINPSVLHNTGNGQMEEEDEDYMSEAFLRGLDDVRPGLVPLSHGRKRRSLNVEPKAPAPPKAKQRKVQEMAAAREEGLSKPLTADNKGFSMLMKMGYKEGEGLGKSGQHVSKVIGCTFKVVLLFYRTARDTYYSHVL